MEDKNKPYFVNGELKIGNEIKEKDDYKEVKESKGKDLFLSLIAILLIVYGVYSLANSDNKKSKVKEEDVVILNENKSDEDEDIKLGKASIYKDIILTSDEEKNVYTAEDLVLIKSTGLTKDQMSNNVKLSFGSKLCSLISNNGVTYIKGSQMDSAIKAIFGDISYEKTSFVIGLNSFIYDKEFDRYIVSDSRVSNLMYKKIDVVESYTDDNKVIVKDYVYYTLLDNSNSWTIDSKYFNKVIDNENFENYKLYIKYYQYVYSNENYLENIIIR